MTGKTDKKDSLQMEFSVAQSNPPDLEDRFQIPEGWRWHAFTTPDGRRIRFGSVTPKSRVPDAIVIALEGLSEYGEKYFELARELNEANLGFWVMDWQGQGRSERYLNNPFKRHSTSFEQDVEDLRYFIMEYVKHSAVHPEVGRIPLVMMGHSMGANIGFHYLHKYPETFECAAFVAPMTGIFGLKKIPMATSVTALMSRIAGSAYVPGGKDWHKDSRDLPINDIFSSDKARNDVHNKWMLQDPALQVGNVTFKWLYEAQKSCLKLNEEFARAINVPCLIGIAGNEKLVDNDRTRKFVSALPNGKLIEFENSKHEILMETDDIRDAFLTEFYEMLRKHKIKDQLKPF